MSRGLKIVLFAVGFLAATGLEAARAAEAFLCEGGRIVHVPIGKLEEMKRTDACIASYFGLTITPSPVAPAQGDAWAAPTQATPAQTAPAQAAPAQAAPPPHAARAAPAPAVALRRLDPQEPTSTRPPKPSRVADAAQPLRAAAGTDFRNVVVINASDGAARIYRHER